METPVHYAAMKETAALEAANICHRYHDEAVLDNVSLQVRKGQILGLLGPNGAGKSTLLHILAGVMTPVSGHVSIDGQALSDAPELLRRIGYLPANPPLYDDLTPLEQLRFAAKLQRLPGTEIDARIDAVLHDCLLKDASEQRIGRLSTGYRQRVGLAQALLHQPAILLLDEPSNGLDPLQTRAFHALLRSLQAATAILFSSHNLGEVKALCSDVVILHRGQRVFAAAMEQIDEPLEQLFTRLIYA